MDIAPVVVAPAAVVAAVTPSPLDPTPVSTPTNNSNSAAAAAGNEFIKVVTAGLADVNLPAVLQRLQQGESLASVRFSVITKDIAKVAATVKAMLRTAGLEKDRLVRTYKTEKIRFLIISSQKPGSSMMAILPPFLAPHVLTDAEKPQFPLANDAEKTMPHKSSVRLAFLRSYVQDDTRGCAVEKNSDVYTQVLKHVPN